MAGEIESVITQADLRGISRLVPYLPPEYCRLTAEMVIASRPRAMLVTGFYVNGAPETDGPPGAVALADALIAMGFEVVLVTDRVSFEVLEAIAPSRAKCVSFPAGDDRESMEAAAALIALYRPTVLGFIERPGLTADCRYFNMRGVDVTEHCAMTDYLLDHGVPSFAVGDGGNEAGMGRWARRLASEGITQTPAFTVADHVVAASVSNWGALGLVAYLSILRGRDLLPELETEAARIRTMVRMGAVDGFSGDNVAKVDGKPLEESLLVLAKLKDLVDDALGP